MNTEASNEDGTHLLCNAMYDIAIDLMSVTCSDAVDTFENSISITWNFMCDS